MELTGTGASLPLIWKVDPTTLTVQQLIYRQPVELRKFQTPGTHGRLMVFVPARRKTRFIGKVREQVAGLQVTRYSATISIRIEFYKVFDFGKVEGDWRLYGTGFRIDPVSDDMYCFWYHEFLDPEHELAVVETDGRGEKNGTIKGRYPYDITNYWFPALPVFPDNEAPVIQAKRRKR